MAYDEDLADRIRAWLSAQADVTEKRMFGGLAFLVSGRMALAVGSQGGLLLRVDPGVRPALLVSSRARPATMGGRELRGWLQVDLDDAASEAELGAWVDRGVAAARSLPPR